MTSRIALFSFGLLLLAGCGTTNTAGPSFTSSLSLVSTKISKTADIIGESTRQASASRIGFGSEWTQAGGVNALSNDGTETLQAWMSHMFDPSFVNSNSAKVTFAGRISNGLSVLCFIANAGITADASGLPADGSHTVTVTAAMATACGLTREGSDIVGQSITLAVSTPTDTTIYDKIFSASLPGSEDCPFKFQAKATATDVNIASAEDQNCEDRNQASGSIFRYNSATQISRFTYTSQNFDSGSRGFEFYRGVLDEAADEAYVLGIYGGTTDGTLSSYIAFTAAGKPTAGGTAALSVRTLAQSIDSNMKNGCINTSTNALGTDDTLTCTLTGTDIDTAFPVINSTKSANTAISSIYDIGATTDLRFTSHSDIYTY